MLCQLVVKKKSDKRAHELRITHLAKAPAFGQIKVDLLTGADVIDRFQKRSDNAVDETLPAEAMASVIADRSSAPERKTFTLDVGSRCKELDIIFAGGALLPATGKSVATYAEGWKTQLLNTEGCSTTFTLPIIGTAVGSGVEARSAIDILAATVAAAAADSDGHGATGSAEVPDYSVLFLSLALQH